MRRLLVIALTVLPACSLFTSLGDLSGNEPALADASPEGAAVDAQSDAGGGGGTDGSNDDVTTPIVDAGLPNLHPNGAFEFSCQGWYPYNAKLDSDPLAHGGSASCRVCSTATLVDVSTIDENGAVENPVTGGVYYAAGWFRAAENAPPPPSGVKLVFGTRDTGGGEVEYAQTSLIAIDTTWKKLEVQLTVTKDAKRLRIWAGGKAQEGTCFLIDDVRVERRQ